MLMPLSKVTVAPVPSSDILALTPVNHSNIRGMPPNLLSEIFALTNIIIR